jgi:hypothetical protein
MRARPTRGGATRAAALFTVAGLAGCALDWSYTTISGGGGGARDGGGDGNSASSSGASGTSGGTSSGASSSGSTSGEAGPPPDAGPSCRANGECGSGAVCHFEDHLCGKGQPGHCKPLRTQCNVATPYVCSCDGTVDADECAANGRGQDLSAEAACTTPGFRYRCGGLYCVTGVSFAEFCVKRTSFGEDIYACENAFDFSCSTPACTGCDPHGCACATIPGGAMLTCP